MQIAEMMNRASQWALMNGINSDGGELEIFFHIIEKKLKVEVNIYIQ